MSPPRQNVAIVTGGASGIGLEVCKALAARKDWSINILDLNEERGNKAAKDLNATFYAVDVSKYASLAEAFKKIYTGSNRIDFVFANAGIVGSGDFYKTHDTGVEPPPEFPSTVVDVNLISVMNTSYLAQHYFRQTPRDDLSPRSLIVTASCGGIYSAPAAPTYAAAKFGTVGWMRSIAPRLWREDGIRVNAILPGTVRTNLLPDSIWSMFPAEFFTPPEKIVEVVLMLVDGKEKEPTNGVEATEPLFGQAVEVNCDKYHFRKQHDFCDDVIAAVMPTET